jgi:hypothetical protein
MGNMGGMGGGGIQQPQQLAANPRGGLPTAVDEKKLRVTMLLDFVKILPTQGR